MTPEVQTHLERVLAYQETRFAKLRDARTPASAEDTYLTALTLELLREYQMVLEKETA